MESITIKATINAPIEKVWKFWSSPEHITQWYFASEDWHAPKAENDFRTGGKFLTRMEAKDGSFGFDFEGRYELVKTNELISYTLIDERRVTITFTEVGKSTQVIETFDAENENHIDMQSAGWQNILNNFKHYTETNI